MTTRNDQRDVICLRRHAKCFHTYLNRPHEFIDRQVSFCLNERGESDFAILFSLRIRCLSDSVCANHQEIPWKQIYFLDVALPFEKQSEHGCCACQMLFLAIRV